MHNDPANNAMAVSISQSAARANPKRGFWEVFAVALVVSVSVHGTLVAWSRTLPPLPERAAGSAASAPSATQVDETDLVDVSKSSGDAVVRGDENKVQGGSESTLAKAVPAATKPPEVSKVDPTPPKPPEHEASSLQQRASARTIALGEWTSLLEVKSGAPKDKTLDGRADVQPLKSQQVAAGGFITVGTFRSVVAALLLRADAPAAGGQADQLFDGLPHKGQTPIVYQGTVSQSPFQSRFTMNVPKASIEDVTALVNSLKK